MSGPGFKFDEGYEVMNKLSAANFLILPLFSKNFVRNKWAFKDWTMENILDGL